MKNVKTCFASILLCMLGSCSGPQINETYTANLIKKELSIKDVFVRKLKSAGSGSLLFQASAGEKKYVVKFIRGNGENEIYNSKIASDVGYGPKVYFADVSQGILIEEFVSGKITLNDLESDQICEPLALFLQKMHRGPQFHSSYDGFGRVTRMMHGKKAKYFASLMPKIEEIFNTVRKALTPYITKAPCHNDLSFENLQFVRNQCKAIDFGEAGLSDPYFDVASALLSTGSLMAGSYEKKLFAIYLGREPTSMEIAKLYVMKQFVLLRWIVDGIERSCKENIQQYDSVVALSFEDVLKKCISGDLDVRTSEDNIKVLKSLFKQLIENFESQEFRSAVQLLTGDAKAVSTYQS